MQKFKVGGYFYGYPKAMQEGCMLLYDAGGPTLLVSLSAMDAKEAKKIQKGKINFALFEKDGIMFLLVDIPGAIDWSDAPFHIGLHKDDRPVPDGIPEGKGLGLTVLGMDANTSMIKALRLVGLGTDISREMIRIISEQKSEKTNPVDHHNNINRIYREYNCEKMAKRAVAVYKVGARE